MTSATREPAASDSVAEQAIADDSKSVVNDLNIQHLELAFGQQNYARNVAFGHTLQRKWHVEKPFRGVTVPTRSR